MPRTRVTYNGSELTSVDEGCKTTLKCNGQLMKTDLVISSDLPATYEDKTIVEFWLSFVGSSMQGSFANPDTTWEQWCESPANHWDLRCRGNHVYLGALDKRKVYIAGEDESVEAIYVQPSHIICSMEYRV